MFSYFKAKIYRDFFTNLLFYRQIRAKTLERYNGEFVDHPASLKCGKKKLHHMQRYTVYSILSVVMALRTALGLLALSNCVKQHPNFYS